ERRKQHHRADERAPDPQLLLGVELDFEVGRNVGVALHELERMLPGLEVDLVLAPFARGTDDVDRAPAGAAARLPALEAAGDVLVLAGAGHAEEVLGDELAPRGR